jgi:hypothetical protein
MSMIRKIFAASAGIAAIAAAGPAAAQYGYGYQPYAQPYAYGYQQPYAYGAGANTNAMASQCTAAVQNRLYTRTGLSGILGSLIGAAGTTPRVLSVTDVRIRSNGMYRVRGLASSGRYASNGYGPYGVGAYGALGYSYNNAADLSFRCDVAPNGSVYNVSINRR